MKTFDKQYYNLIGSESEFRKILDDKRLKPLVRKLFVSMGDKKSAEKTLDAFLKPLIDLYNGAFPQDAPSRTGDHDGSDGHQQCLDAKDYEGCMRFNQSKTAASSG